jgi:hypothetical protein
VPGYDPQRGRPRQRVADDDGPAPVDALLGPSPDEPEPVAPDADAEVPVGAAVIEPATQPPVADDTVAEPAEPARREPLVIDLDQPAPVNVPRHRGRLVLYALAALSVVLQILAWRWWRRRRQRVSE